MMNRMILVLVMTAGALLGVASHAQSDAASSSGDQLQSTRDTLARWVETQQIISKEKKDWQLGREVLSQRISLIESEINTLNERTEETRGHITEADKKRQELIDENAALKAASTSMVDVIASLEEKTRGLLAVLPRPIVERVEPLSQRIPSKPAETGLSLSERFQNVIGVLNEVNKFNRDITVATEVREMPDGVSAEVETIYFGLGQAYYVTASGDGAGVGRPSETGWAWSEADHLAERVIQAIAIVKNEQVPAYVSLPVEIR
jgi:hypothetical protein